MAWFSEQKKTWLETLCMNVLKNGPIPRHVAFIMDGNRRYAHKVGVQKVRGHALGFEKLSQTLGWCLDLEIKEVTLYTFSIENYKRSEDEVTGLMDLFREKLKQLLDEKEKIDEHEVCIRMIGDLSLLPADIQELVAKVVLSTQHYSKMFLNVCISYTSRDEITNGIREIAQGYVDKKLQLSDVTEDLISRSLYSGDASSPDLLVRTSGEVRLSDFLLWQSTFSVLAFLKVLWPEFTIWDFFLAVLYYQHHIKHIKHTMESLPAVSEEAVNTGMQERQSAFLEELRFKRIKQLSDMKEGNAVQKTPNRLS